MQAAKIQTLESDHERQCWEALIKLSNVGSEGMTSWQMQEHFERSWPDISWRDHVWRRLKKLERDGFAYISGSRMHYGNYYDIYRITEKGRGKLETQKSRFELDKILDGDAPMVTCITNEGIQVTVTVLPNGTIEVTAHDVDRNHHSTQTLSLADTAGYR